MDPRVREDDAGKTSRRPPLAVIPPLPSHLPLAVIPAPSRHSCAGRNPSPSSALSASQKQKMDPRVREDDAGKT